MDVDRVGEVVVFVFACAATVGMVAWAVRLLCAVEGL